MLDIQYCTHNEIQEFQHPATSIQYQPMLARPFISTPFSRMNILCNCKVNPCRKFSTDTGRPVGPTHYPCGLRNYDKVTPIGFYATINSRCRKTLHPWRQHFQAFGLDHLFFRRIHLKEKPSTPKSPRDCSTSKTTLFQLIEDLLVGGMPIARRFSATASEAGISMRQWQ